MSCIDLIFCTNQSVTSNHGVDVSIDDKCHDNIIYGKINIRVPLPPNMCERSGIIKKQMLKILRQQYITLIGIKLSKISQ